MADEDEVRSLAIVDLRSVAAFGVVFIREIAGWVRGRA